MDFDIIVLNTEADPDAATLGNQLLVLAHELGHSLYRQELDKSLTNSVLRKQLQTEFLKDQKFAAIKLTIITIPVIVKIIF
mgnify:CR=1 FL=1